MQCVRWPPPVSDCVLRDPQITFSENSLDIETLALLDDASASLADCFVRGFAGLTEDNRKWHLDIVFSLCIAGCRSLPVSI